MRSKKDAVIAGGCFLSRMSIGLGADTHSWLLRHRWLEQHSGSSQSVKPSAISK